MQIQVFKDLSIAKNIYLDDINMKNKTATLYIEYSSGVEYLKISLEELEKLTGLGSFKFDNSKE